MLKCRKCGQSDFGVIAKQIMAAPFRVIGGEQQIPLGTAETSQEIEYTHCYGCNTPITEADLYEQEACGTCGKLVDELIEGNCVDCNAEIVKAKELEAKVKALNKLTKAELIDMLIKGEINQSDLAVAMTASSSETANKTEKEIEPVKEQEVENKEAKREQNQEIETVTPSIEPETSAHLSQTESVDIDNFDFEVPDVEMDSANEELDILAQIDQAVDLSSLNIQDEDINQQI